MTMAGGILPTSGPQRGRQAMAGPLIQTANQL
jgi:hypothetical protein